MRHKSGPHGTAEKHIKDIRRATRKQYSAEEKIRIVLEGLRGEYSIAELCRREGFVVYMGDDIYGVKWRNWKQNFKEQDMLSSETREYGMPKLYNLYVDPQERENVLFPNTWVPKAALGVLGQHLSSLRKEPPIKTGTPDPYAPPNE